MQILSGDDDFFERSRLPARANEVHAANAMAHRGNRRISYACGMALRRRFRSRRSNSAGAASPKLLFDIEKDETLTRICQRYRKSGRIIGKGRRIVKNVAHAKSQD